MNFADPAAIHHLRAGGVSIVLDSTTPYLPAIAYWGADLGDLDMADLTTLATTSPRHHATGGRAYLSILPENSHTWTGTPGIEGHRDGRDFSTLFSVESTELTALDDGTHHVEIGAADAAAGLSLVVQIELMPSGLARMRARVTNTADGVYTLDSLTPAWPVGDKAVEILDFAGRWGRERQPQRHAFVNGTYVREGRRGRTGPDATLLLMVGEAGFNFGSGEVWGIHTAWSGNHRTVAEHSFASDAILAGGEILLPGEVRLARGESYASPWIYASYGVGIDAVSSRFHRFVRAQRAERAERRGPRPVTGNSWEAVYFRHDLAPLKKLADAFASVGVERFVLDDGWFRHRRNDKAGLGDWYVDQGVWPDGLAPLADYVRSLGMEFGLWFEPEMVNPDSDLARAHPDWIMATGDRLPPEQRHQEVLNLGIPEAYAYIHERMAALIGELRIAYIKWDHNRDLVEAGDQHTGQAGTHRQTLATYRLFDQLKAEFPALEIESCSSGGARCDLGIMLRADRMWASDCTDAHERQLIQRDTGLLLPPELMGCHVSADPNHQTGRRLSLAMRVATAFFGDLGVEWNVAKVSGDDRRELAEWIAEYKRWRGLLHSGDVVHIDYPNPAMVAHGVVAADKSQALFGVFAMETSADDPIGPVRLPGLDPCARYRVALVPKSLEGFKKYYSGIALPHGVGEGVELTGRVLAAHGFPLPDMPPDSAILLSATRIG